MADFKILGGTDEATNSLGKMTQGLGFPLRDVDDTTSGGPVSVRQQTVFESASYVNQEPTGLGIATQITFGPAQETPEFSIDDNGAITCLMADEYDVRLKFSTGRDGAAQVSQLYVRALLDGVQAGDSTHTIVDTQRIEVPQFIERYVSLSVGQVITFEQIRDTDGNNSGGLHAGNPDVPGWNSSPSASISITRTFAIQTTN